jgi:hypothetical protein
MMIANANVNMAGKEINAKPRQSVLVIIMELLLGQY